MQNVDDSVDGQPDEQQMQAMQQQQEQMMQMQMDPNQM